MLKYPSTARTTEVSLNSESTRQTLQQLIYTMSNKLECTLFALKNGKTRRRKKLHNAFMHPHSTHTLQFSLLFLILRFFSFSEYGNAYTANIYKSISNFV